MKNAALLGGLATLLLSLGVTDVAHARQRMVVVNGALQNPTQLVVRDRYACGVIPDGRCWLNYDTGIWGFAGDPRPVGHISEGCARPDGSAKPSLSERGMLYSRDSWGRGR